MVGQKELNMFLANPEQYVPPLAPKKLPPPALLPKRINADGLKDRKPEINGYCPVTYVHGKLRFVWLFCNKCSFICVCVNDICTHCSYKNFIL